ncbi:MAG: DUF2452 domain-containing protein [Bacteroidia bacterium]|nr:DUF2452 domain-containing protein [Bacteroidia bacterium]
MHEDSQKKKDPTEFVNPIDKDKVAENPGLLAFPHHVGSAVIRPEDEGKIKSRALTAMRDQTQKQLEQIRKQAELLQQQALEITQRMQISEKIYMADIPFEPFVGHSYHLYYHNKENKYKMMMIGPEEWGKKVPENLEFIATVKLLSDYTWEILEQKSSF